MVRPNFLLVLMIFSLPFTFAQINHSRNLIKDLFRNYTKELRPRNDPHEPSQIYIDMVPIQLMGVNTRQQVVRLFAWSRKWWYDDRLFWNPKDYGGIDTLSVDTDRLWTPSIYNEYDVLIDEAKSVREMPIVLQPKIMRSGRRAALIRQLTPVIYQLYCNNLVQAFPYDYVYCIMNFTSWTNDADEINVTTVQGFIANQILSNLEWEYKDYYLSWTLGENTEDESGNATQSYLSVETLIRRKATFYIHSMLLPALISVQLSIFAMFLTADSSGDRAEMVSMGFITLLGISFLLIRVGDDTPKASDPEPSINQLFLNQVILISVAISTTFGLIYLQVYGKDGPPIPRILAKIFLRKELEEKEAEPKTDRLVYEETMPQAIVSSRSTVSNEELWRQTYINLKVIESIMEDAKRLAIVDEIACENSRLWRKIVRRLDLFCLTVFTSLHALIMAYFFMSTTKNQAFDFINLSSD